MANHDSKITGPEATFPTSMANGEASQSLVAAPPAASPSPQTFGGFFPRGPEILNGPFNQVWLINCLRRKWLPALLLGLLAAATAAGVLLILFPISSEVTAVLKFETGQEGWGFERKRALTKQEVEDFQQSQLALFKSQFVLKAALTPREILELDVVVDQGENALIWLNDELKMRFQGDILEIRYEGEEDPEDMKKVVNAVINAYMSEVLAKENMLRATTREMLGELHKKTTEELQEKIDRYETLANEMGGGDAPLATAMLTMLIRDLGAIDLQIDKAKAELEELEIGKQMAIQEARSPAALDRIVAEELERDPTMASYQADKFELQQYIRQLQTTTKRGISPKIKQLQQQYYQLEQAEAEYRRTAEAEIRQRLKNTPNELLQAVTTEYILRSNSIKKRIAQLLAEREEKMQEINRKGVRSAELAMQDSEIEQLREIEREMAIKLRSEEVESETAQDRVMVMQWAQVAEKINKFERYAIASLGGIAAFFGTCYGVALIEFRRRRLNGPADVDEGLGIRVLGVLPSISSRKAMVPGSPIAAQLSESIDNVRATLMHDSTSRPRQVVLVTSASSSEGSTTVASHLALSLARAGRRTLLIDGDLRQPSIHKLFGMPLEDGLSELLREEIDVAEALRPTNTEGLWLLTAGQCDMDAVQALAADQLQPIFQKLRAEFDFIVIDGAPVLSLSDSLSIGQHVDGAILTVLRDHSEIRSIYQASELLKNMGIRVIGSVVNGVTTKADSRVAKLYRLETQQPRKLSAKTGS